MKKTSLFLMMVMCAAMTFAQHYGILVNGKTYFAAEYKGKDSMTGQYDEYLAHVKVKSGDTFTLYNAMGG